MKRTAKRRKSVPVEPVEDEVTITVTVGPRVARDLETLLFSGLFGWSVEQVAEGLLLEALRAKIGEGWTRPRR